MGSASDLEVMQGTVEVLGGFRGAPPGARGIRAPAPPTTCWPSYHAAAGNGLEVIIRGAGGAAHLAGMLAAVTPLRVIGVWVALRQLEWSGSRCFGFSRMRRRTGGNRAVNGAHNAGLLRCASWRLGRDLYRAMEDFQAEIADVAREQDPASTWCARGGRRR